jgi:uncharacterized membrane protein
MHMQAVETEHRRVPAHAVRVRRVNVGSKERAVSGLLGAALAYLAIRQKPWWARLPMAGVALFLAKRGLTGSCDLYGLLKVSTVENMPHRGVDSGTLLSRLGARVSRVQRSVTVARPRHEVFRFWRDFRNWPLFMERLEAVHALDDGHFRAVVKGRGDKMMEWEIEVEGEGADEHITWIATYRSEVLFRANLKLKDAPGDRGTEVTLTMGAGVPGGPIPSLVMGVMLKNPDRTVRKDLARFKQMMETGELITSASPSAREKGG